MSYLTTKLVTMVQDKIPKNEIKIIEIRQNLGFHRPPTKGETSILVAKR